MLELSNRPNTKMDAKRTKEFTRYIESQEDFISLAKKWILTYYKVSRLQEELDVDSLSETQTNKLDNCKDKDSREKMLEELPKIKVAYSYLYVRPNYIGDEVNKEDRCLDDLDTATIKMINDWLVDKLKLYKDYLDVDELGIPKF